MPAATLAAEIGTGGDLDLSPLALTFDSAHRASAIHCVRYGRFEHDMSLFLDLSHSAGNSGPVRGSRCTTLDHQGA